MVSSIPGVVFAVKSGDEKVRYPAWDCRGDSDGLIGLLLQKKLSTLRS